MPILILSIEFLSEKRKCYIGKLDTLQAYALVDCVGFLVLLITKKVAKRFIFLFLFKYVFFDGSKQLDDSLSLENVHAQMSSITLQDALVLTIWMSK